MPRHVVRLISPLPEQRNCSVLWHGGAGQVPELREDSRTGARDGGRSWRVLGVDAGETGTGHIRILLKSLVFFFFSFKRLAPELTSLANLLWVFFFFFFSPRPPGT